jgi:molybdenum cofactor cytidylyltransferase
LELDQIRHVLRESPHVLIVGATSGDGKAFGVAPEVVDELIALHEIDVVLVEADGSRMRSFKAPAEHEPVVPQSTTLLVPVVGIDVLGKTLNDENVHRATLVAQLAEIPLETSLTPEHIARLLAHPQGGLKNKPASARVISLINKVETDAQNAAANQIADVMLQQDSILAVAIGAVKNQQPSVSNLQSRVSNLQFPISSLQTRVAAVILAAGGSTRMRGETKQLLPWGDETLVQNAVRVAQRARVAEIIVVTGNRADDVTRALGETNARLVFNPEWASGRASSVRAGILALRENTAAAIFINADQPFLTAVMLDEIIARYASARAPVIVPTFDGQPGSPVLFARELFDELTALQGDVGGKVLLEKYRAQVEKIAIADTRAALDLDTPEEYARARAIK